MYLLPNVQIVFFIERLTGRCNAEGEVAPVAPAVEGIDLLKVAGHSTSEWIPSAVRPPFCSQIEERIMLWLEFTKMLMEEARYRALAYAMIEANAYV